VSKELLKQSSRKSEKFKGEKAPSMFI